MAQIEIYTQTVTKEEMSHADINIRFSFECIRCNAVLESEAETLVLARKDFIKQGVRYACDGDSIGLCCPDCITEINTKIDSQSE